MRFASQQTDASTCTPTKKHAAELQIHRPGISGEATRNHADPTNIRGTWGAVVGGRVGLISACSSAWMRVVDFEDKNSTTYDPD